MAWRDEGNELVQDYEFPDFGAALAFVNEVGKLAEAKGHHPNILVHDWNQVRLMLSTHSKGGVTDLDRELAEAIDDL
jgi:4a-hydroxytetrahydrobiopterin dehydratase